MKISLNAVKEIYKQSGVDASFLPDDINKIAEKIGAQLGEIEEIIDLGKRYEGAVIAKVVSCEFHPNADKLKVCKIDVGKSDFVQVVCGAPNVQADMLAVWLPPGSTVPATYGKDPFVLEARELRGEMSNGMLASAHELGINDDHSGIVEVDKKAEPGDSFAETYKLNDYIIDVENKMFTHRPDCFGLLGVARELAGIYGVKFASPEWYQLKADFAEGAVQHPLPIQIKNELPQLVPRFMAVTIADVSVGPSPLWLQIALSKFGIKSINNIVDLTNFYMAFTGQPLHAYDYDKVAALSGNGAVIEIRHPQKGEKIKLLNGKEIEAGSSDIAIATDKILIGLGGVIGGVETEVDASTKNIILECANFDPYSIRRTSMAHGIFTDAVTRFSKGQSPHQVRPVSVKISNDITRLTGGQISGGADEKGDLVANKPVKISTEFINNRLGLELKKSDIKSLLSNVEFAVDARDGELHITAPFWRMDIEIPEDIVEEVGRLYGYDHLPLKLPQRTISPAMTEPALNTKQVIRNKLPALGANELLTYSFVHGDLLEKTGQHQTKSYKLKNALSPQLQYYRQSLTPSLLANVHPNIKAGFDNFALFEMGKTHVKGQEQDGVPEEFSQIAVVVASKNGKTPAYYAARDYLINLLAALGVDGQEISFETNDKLESYYLPGRAATVRVGADTIGTIGEYDQKVSRNLKLPEFCAGFELDLEALLKLKLTKKYQPLSRYPGLQQDITLKTDKAVSFAEIKAELKRALDTAAPEDVSCSVHCLDIFSNDEKTKQTTFRITASSYERTLTVDSINLLLEKVAEDMQKSLKAHRI